MDEFLPYCRGLRWTGVTRYQEPRTGIVLLSCVRCGFPCTCGDKKGRAASLPPEPGSSVPAGSEPPVGGYLCSPSYLADHECPHCGRLYDPFLGHAPNQKHWEGCKSAAAREERRHDTWALSLKERFRRAFLANPHQQPPAPVDLPRLVAPGEDATATPSPRTRGVT